MRNALTLPIPRSRIRLEERTRAMDRTREAAKAIVAARLSTTALSPLPASVRPQNIAKGYKVQDAVHEMLAETEWGRVVGHKIGCTTSVMQQYLKIAHPCAGG